MKKISRARINKKLKLSCETLRLLAAAELNDVIGGAQTKPEEGGCTQSPSNSDSK